MAHVKLTRSSLNFRAFKASPESNGSVTTIAEGTTVDTVDGLPPGEKAELRKSDVGGRWSFRRIFGGKCQYASEEVYDSPDAALDAYVLYMNALD